MTVTSGAPRPTLRQTWRRLGESLGRGVDRGEVTARVGEGGRLGGGYLMMTAISAAIAILGLLLSSPAVVIGAMLLSPLMGPILLLGFAFWTVDWAQTRRALGSLAAGFAVALVVSILLVAASPLKEPTAEILARSRPTLFDLLVAVFSGVAGGYAVVRQRGETVIGVAIATALMPPLAVVGFGVGTRSWPIAGGALLLFLTNLIAIALAAAFVAALSGFRPARETGGRSWLQHAAVVVILLVLCVPLTLSLRTIALESRATTEARTALQRVFGPKARVASLTVRDDHARVKIDGLIATPRYVGGASARLRADLSRRLRAPVDISLDQVVLADPSRLKPEAAAAPGAPPPRDPAADLRGAVPFPDATVGYDAATGVGLVLLGAGSGLDLAGARALEAGLRQGPAGEKTVVSPPVSPLPPLPLDGSARGAPPTLADPGLQLWALRRWRAGAVSARLCPRRGRPTQAALRPVLQAALAPLPVTLSAAPASACATSGASAPFVLLAPAAAPLTPQPAPPPAPPSATPAR